MRYTGAVGNAREGIWSQPPGPRVSVVMPAFNEAATIETTLREAAAALDRLAERWEVVVVDDGSTDRTALRVRALADAEPRIVLIRHPRNRGYGVALHTAITSARMEWVLFTDGDGQFDVGELGSLLPRTIDADVICGYRGDRQDPVLRRWAGSAWNLLLRRAFHLPVRDVDCAFKLIRASAIQGVHLRCHGAAASAELLLRLRDRGARIIETPVTHRPRTAGRATGLRVSVVARAVVEVAALPWILHRQGVGWRPGRRVALERPEAEPPG